MNSSSVVIVAQSLALILPTPVSAATRQPNEKWVVNYDNAQCVASRSYGTAEKPLILIFKPSPVGDVMQLSVLRKGASGGGLADETGGDIRVDQERPISVSILSYGMKRGIVSSRINLMGNQFAAIRRASKIAIRNAQINETLALSQIPELMKSIDACVADLQIYWNIAADAQAKLTSRAHSLTSLVGVFDSNDYPSVALQKQEDGTVEIVLLIDETGGIAECVVTQTSSVAALDAQVCSIIAKRAKFSPAIGADQKPAKDSFSQRITWKTGSGG